MKLRLATEEDTIAAIATPPGQGGIAIIRVSGDKAIGILKKIFESKEKVDEFVSGKVYFGNIVDQQVKIDEVLVTVFRRPKSYTREDVVEISCHGGVYVSQRILQLVLKNGARLAEAGEFTKRAFLNGRIDLSQAEAVADLIMAKTEKSLRASLQQLEGYLRRKINRLRNELLDICSFMELELDFSEEDIEFVTREEIVSRLKNVLGELHDLIASYDKGKIIREGAKLAIIGRPNVGKSSLLNALLKEDRAIVTEIPGTTRDSLEEQLDIKGVLFRVVDTAGLTETENIVEQQGIERTYRHIDTADLIIHVFDGSEQFKKEDQKIIAELLQQPDINKKVVCVINKIDLQRKLDVANINYKWKEVPIVETSAKEMIGIDNLEEIIYKRVISDNNIFGDNSSLVVTKLRHFEALRRAAIDVENSLHTLKKNLSSEFVVVDLRSALDNLGEIVGEVTSEDILNNIFSKFCIGK